MESPWILPALALPLLSGVMAWVWWRQRATGNAGAVDLVWTASIGFLAVAYAMASPGWLPRRVLVAVLVGAWSARLSAHLWIRLRTEREDGRYAALRRTLGARFDLWIFWFFQVQAVLAVVLSLLFLPLVQLELPGWRVWDLVAVALWVVSIAGETLADGQLRAWRSDPANAGRTCRRGLWGYSRHPNYFFEWLHWLVYPVLGIGLPYGALLWGAPALMLYLILKVTGIPPTEEQSLRSRGADYRAYMRTTNAFFPGPPRAAS